MCSFGYCYFVLTWHKNAAACMTWELAESGADFITSVVNGADLVPTFSAASVDDLRAEVMLLNSMISILPRMFWYGMMSYLSG